MSKLYEYKFKDIITGTITMISGKKKKETKALADDLVRFKEGQLVRID